jgi:ankyrin repeat protein
MQLRLLQSVVSFSEVGDEPETTSVHEAAKTGLGMAEALAQDGWAKDMPDSTGMVPLHWAAARGHVEATQMLIDKRADVNVVDGDNFTPLNVAALNDEAECMRRLLLAGCRVDKVDMQGDTALHLAAAYGSVEAVRLLLSVGAKGSACAENVDRPRPLHRLAESHKIGATSEAIERTAGLLLAASAESLESRDRYGSTPFFKALVYDNLPLVRYLVRAGALLNVVNDVIGCNLLHIVALSSTATTVEFLLEAEQCDATGQMDNIDHRLPDNYDGTPWDEFMHAVHAPPWVVDRRHPDRRTRRAFVKLYRAIRDRNIRHDISILQSTVDALSKHDTFVAQSYLSDLAARKAECHNTARANFYRAFSQQVKAGETEAASLGIQEDLGDLFDELDSSPWDQDHAFHVFEGAHWCQWVDFPGTSLWIEPVDAILDKSSSNIYETEEPQGEVVPEGEEEEKEGEGEGEGALDHEPRWYEKKVFEVDRKVNCGRITQIYSNRGILLYDRKAGLCSPREFLQRYEHGEAGR